MRALFSLHYNANVHTCTIQNIQNSLNRAHPMTEITVSVFRQIHLRLCQFVSVCLFCAHSLRHAHVGIFFASVSTVDSHLCHQGNELDRRMSASPSPIYHETACVGTLLPPAVPLHVLAPRIQINHGYFNEVFLTTSGIKVCNAWVSRSESLVSSRKGL